MGANVHPSAVIGERVELAEGVRIGPNCVIDNDVVIGEGTELQANVVIGPKVKLGAKNQLFPGCAVGMQPQLLGLDPDKEIGSLVIGDNNIIREFVTIHPSIYKGEETSVGSGNLLMIGVHIGHDCLIEDKVVISNYSQISGHGKIETGVWISGMVAVHQFVTFGKWCYAAGFAGVNQDVPPFVIVSGHYPPEIRTLNKRGLDRAGLDEEQQESITEVFKKVYRNNDGVFIDRVKKACEQDGLDENARYMLQSILRSNEHRFGRYREKFRH
jgi:UDP-N-acetylglucosamine acyltransferase